VHPAFDWDFRPGTLNANRQLAEGLTAVVLDIVSNDVPRSSRAQIHTTQLEVDALSSVNRSKNTAVEE